MNEIYCFMTGRLCEKLREYKYCSKENKKVFALIPFREPYFDYYKFAIKDFYTSNNFECSYGGESAYIDGEYVICKICEEIYKSSLIIADISDNNPNVYYELGIAHGLGKSTIAIVNKNIANENDQDILPFLSGKCDRIYYDGIYSLKCELSIDARNFPVLGNINSEEDENEEDKYSLICLIPKERRYERKIEKYAEVYKYGIKEALQNLEFPGDELGGLDKEIVCNIIDEARDPIECDVQNIIKKISQARYCIIDITENGHQEVFYWLGFIHGLRVNPDVRLRSDLICLYITSGKMKELPFDIRAARIIYYNSIEELNVKIKKEVEQLEVFRIKEYNKEKEKFWKTFNVKNTQFLVGASDVYPIGEKEEIRNRISIQDFKAYNRIIYQLLFIGPRQSFQYNLKELELSKFFNKEEYRYISKEINSEDKKSNLSKMRFEGEEFEKIILKKEKCGIKNMIIIGSSCVNPAAENVMNIIYKKESSRRPIFKTSHLYKSRSYHWEYFYGSEDKKRDTEVSGIYVSGVQCGCRERWKCNKKNEYFLTKDTALLIICSSIFYSKIYYRNKNEDMKREEADGDIILLSGFGKYGTYELSRILSKINKKPKKSFIEKNQNEKIFLKKDNDERYLTIEKLLFIINEIKKQDNYCAEIIFDFTQELKIEDKKECEKNKCYDNCNIYKNKQKTILKSIKSIIVNTSGEVEEKEDLLNKLYCQAVRLAVADDSFDAMSTA